MKIKKIKLISIINIFILLIQLLYPIKMYNITNATNNEDIYDVILFWGQSNMVGSCGKIIKDENGNIIQNERLPDPRYDYTSESSVKLYSKESGIEEEFLSNAIQMNYVKINQEKESVYEYRYIQNKITEITEDTKKIGETLIYNTKTKKLEKKPDNVSGYAINGSVGTNLVPQFCKSYYQKTGHKVIAVHAAHSGKEISAFLPSNDSESTNNTMIYESIVEKYNSAISYMKANGLKVGNKLWVCFQGCADMGKTSTDDYKKTFLKVTKNLKNDLGITKGAIIETVGRLGNNYEAMQNIHNAQELLASENNNIIIGSRYAYERYIPKKEIYNSNDYVANKMFKDSKGNKIPYEDALTIAQKSVCAPHNAIHLTSSALCHIGKETAENVAKYLADYKSPTYDITYSNTQTTNDDVIVTINSNEKLQEIEGWTLSENKKTLTKKYLNNTTEQIRVYDLANNYSDIQIKITNIDKTNPIIKEIKYSTTNLTNSKVIVTAIMNEEIKEVEGWNLSSDKKTLTKEYNQNAKEILTVYDLVGNMSSSKTIDINNIDKISPKVEVSYNTKENTNKDIYVTISSNESIQEVEGWTLLEDQKTLTKTYQENDEENLVVYDKAGNSTSVKVKVNNIDKDSPKVKVNYSTTKYTNEDITVTIESDKELKELEGWILSKNKRELQKIYNTNINEVINVYDILGNQSSVNIKINNIDKSKPDLKTTYKTGYSVNKDKYITVDITSNKELKEITGWILSQDKKILTKTYYENTKETIDVTDLAGNTVQLNININEIEKENMTEKENVKEKEKDSNGNTIKEKTDNNEIKEENNNKSLIDAPKVLPNTGEKRIIEVITVLTIIILVFSFKRYKKYKDI